MLMEVSLEKLFEVGVHFGHRARRWNPKMAPYIFGTKDKVHIINLDKTATMLREAMNVVRNIAADGGRILFVGTKRQASERIAEAANRCGQYYVNHRWLGGMLTNWKTVSQSLKKLEKLEKRLNDQEVILKKKEILQLQRGIDKLNKALGGVRRMGGIPSLLFVVDTNIDRTAVEEARVLDIPVVGICDTNSDPTIIDYPIPGNDDSIRAIDLYCSLFESAVIEGIQQGLVSAGVDVGALETSVEEIISGDNDSATVDEAAQDNVNADTNSLEFSEGIADELTSEGSGGNGSADAS